MFQLGLIAAAARNSINSFSSHSTNSLVSINIICMQIYLWWMEWGEWLHTVGNCDAVVCKLVEGLRTGGNCKGAGLPVASSPHRTKSGVPPSPCANST